jgi:hypothetical protein
MCCVPILIFIPVYVNIGAEIDVAIWSSYELSTKFVSGPDALGSEFDTLYVAGISQSGFHSLIRPNRYRTTGLGRDNGCPDHKNCVALCCTVLHCVALCCTVFMFFGKPDLCFYQKTDIVAILFHVFSPTHSF